jgi:hypothetical protein
LENYSDSFIRGEPTPGASGKTLVVATTHGSVKTECVIDGKKVVTGLNAYIKE